MVKEESSEAARMRDLWLPCCCGDGEGRENNPGDLSAPLLIDRKVKFLLHCLIMMAAAALDELCVCGGHCFCWPRGLSTFSPE